jgi:hypothetical protein
VARLIISDRRKSRLEVNEPTTRRRVNPEEIEKGLGAEHVGLLLPAGSPLSAYVLRQELFRRLRSTGGRPGLDGTDMKPKIPMQRSQWEQLRRLAERVKTDDVHPTPAQLASVLLDAGIDQLNKALAADATGNRLADPDHGRMQPKPLGVEPTSQGEAGSMANAEGLPQESRLDPGLLHEAALTVDQEFHERVLRANADPDIIASRFAEVIRYLMRAAAATDPWRPLYSAGEEMKLVIELLARCETPISWTSLFTKAIESIEGLLPEDPGYKQYIQAAKDGIKYLVESSATDNAARGRASRRLREFIETIDYARQRRRGGA